MSAITYGEVGTDGAGTQVVAGVDLTADTEITVATITMTRGGIIGELSWNYANVVDAKAATGYLEVKSNLKQGPWRFPVGYGCGGALTLGVSTKGTLKVCIPVVVNEILTITMTMNEACVDAHVGIKLGGGGQITYMDCNTAEDAAITAATRESPGSITIPQGKGGVIKKIFVAFAQVISAKLAAGYVELAIQNHPGPFRFPVGGQGGGATDSGFLLNAEEVDVNIPVDNNEIVTFWYYFTDAQVEAHVGIQWVH